MLNKLNHICEQAKLEIETAKSQHELNELRAFYMGKKSPLAEIMKHMASLAIEEKKALGVKANEVKSIIEAAIVDMRKRLEQMEVATKLANETIDVTLPGKTFAVGSKHPLTQTIEEVQDIFIGMG